MMKTYIRFGLALTVAGSLAACGDGGNAALEGAQAAIVSPLAAAEAGTPAPKAAPAPAAERIEIYHDLTAFDWYRQGAALQFQSQGWLPAGKPEKLDAGRLQRAGEYQGVTFYVAKGESPQPRVYVPVFEGWWLPFAPAQGAVQNAD